MIMLTMLIMQLFSLFFKSCYFVFFIRRCSFISDVASVCIICNHFLSEVANFLSDVASNLSDVANFLSDVAIFYQM